MLHGPRPAIAGCDVRTGLRDYAPGMPQCASRHIAGIVNSIESAEFQRASEPSPTGSRERSSEAVSVRPISFHCIESCGSLLRKRQSAPIFSSREKLSSRVHSFGESAALMCSMYLMVRTAMHGVYHGSRSSIECRW